MKTKLIFLVLLIVSLSCGTNNKPVSDAQKEKIKETALRTLTETDRSWCQSVSDLEGFISFLDDEVVWYFCNIPAMKGKDAVHSFCKKLVENKTFNFTWTPERIEVSNSGDMGYTYGTYKVITSGSSTQQQEIIHNYATIWRKNNAGTWKVILEADF
jgi:ketosteroid isomerase-like protein